MIENRYAILIGISQYQDQNLQSLQCPENDVDGLNELLISKEYGNFSETITLKNKPNHEVLLQIEKILENAKKNDLVLIYYSGHGKQDRSGRLNLATTNTIVEYLKSTSISIDSIKNYIDTSKTNKIVFILDCCYSGLAGEAFLRGSVDDVFQSFSKGRGIYILTGSTGFQVALEGKSEKYGEFTKHIIEGIRDWKAANEEGKITMDSLYQYVYKQMLAEGFQKPMKWDLNVEGDLVIASGGKTKRIRRSEDIRKMLLEMSTREVLPDSILSKALSIISIKKEELSKEELLYDNLLDQLFQEHLTAKRFIEDWYELVQKVQLSSISVRLCAESQQRSDISSYIQSYIRFYKGLSTIQKLALGVIFILATIIVVSLNNSTINDQKSILNLNSSPIILNFGSDVISPQEAGTTILWSAEAKDPEKDQILYRFSLNGKPVTDWVGDNMWAWQTSRLDLGKNRIELRIRDGMHSGVDGFDDSKVIQFLISSPKSPPLQGNTEILSKGSALFNISDWGMYSFIEYPNGHYFVSYVNGYLKDISKDVIFKNNLTSKVLSNSRYEWTITSSSPLYLAEGYQLSIKSIDIDGNKIFLELSKDGQVVDSKIVSPSKAGATLADKTYYYKKDLGNTKGIVIIAVHFKNAFRGSDQDLATIDGVWQISDEQEDMALIRQGSSPFSLSEWGNYSFIERSNEKYFAGYIDGYLMKKSIDIVLMNNTTRKIFYDIQNEETLISGRPLYLAQGYQLSIKSIDIDGNKIYLELSKDGQVVDSRVIGPSKDGATLADKTYYYKKDIGNTKDIVIIAAHFKNAFRGSNEDFATIDGLWQISD